MRNERIAFKEKFRKHFDVSEILSLNKFSDKITEHMWLGYDKQTKALERIAKNTDFIARKV